MGREFEIVREFEVAATPEQVWDAITTGTGGWLWPAEPDPAADESVIVWDPPHRLVSRTENAEDMPGQALNQLDRTIEPREGGRAWVRHVHSGIFVDDWDNQYDGAAKHTTFYMHTLKQYLEHFAGRPITFVAVDGPEASRAEDAFEKVVRALGVSADTPVGAEARVDLPGTGPLTAVLDYRDENFLGLRTGDTLYRFFGRNAFGAPVGLTVHRFAPDADEKRIEQTWQTWLTGLYA